MIVDIAAGHISIKYGLRGPNYVTVSACASSNNAIIDSLMLIQLGKSDLIVTGGSEAGVNITGIGGFNALKALSLEMIILQLLQDLLMQTEIVWRRFCCLILKN